MVKMLESGIKRVTRLEWKGKIELLPDRGKRREIEDEYCTLVWQESKGRNLRACKTNFERYEYRIDKLIMDILICTTNIPKEIINMISEYVPDICTMYIDVIARIERGKKYEYHNVVIETDDCAYFYACKPLEYNRISVYFKKDENEIYGLLSTKNIRFGTYTLNPNDMCEIGVVIIQKPEINIKTMEQIVNTYNKNIGYIIRETHEFAYAIELVTQHKFWEYIEYKIEREMNVKLKREDNKNLLVITKKFLNVNDKVNCYGISLMDINEMKKLIEAMKFIKNNS